MTTVMTRRTILLLVSMTVAIIMAGGAVLAQDATGTLDANTPPHSDPYSSSPYANGYDGLLRAQTFTVENTGEITSTQMYIWRHEYGPITMKITPTDEDSRPIVSDVLASTTFSDYEIPLHSSGILTANFSNPVPVVAGKKYALVIYGGETVPSGPVYSFRFNLYLGQNYSGGEGMYRWQNHDESQWSAGPEDYAFAVYVATNPPTVTSTVPLDNAKRVPRGNNITATFSEEMNSSTLDDDTVVLVNTATGAKVAAEIKCDTPCRTVTIDPWTRLGRSTKYKAIITTGAEDRGGMALTENEVWNFTTKRR